MRTLLDRDDSMVRRSAIVAKELARLKIDVAPLQETRLEGRGSLRERTHTFFWSGVKEGEIRQAGVAFAIDNCLVEHMTEAPKHVSERIMTIRLPLKKDRFMTIICVYAPTMPYPDEIKEEFFQNLSNIVNNLNVADKLFILGDFNARVVKNFTLHGPAIGHFGKGKCNANGEMLINFCAEQDLTITNTHFKQPDHHYFTWKHPRSNCYHLLDYVLTKCSQRTEVYNTRAMRGAEVNTDHYLIKSTVNIQIASLNRRAAAKPPRKFCVSKLENTEVKRSMRESLQNKLDTLTISDNVDETWTNMKHAIQNSAEETLGFSKRKNQDWFDDNREIIEEILKDENCTKSSCRWEQDKLKKLSKKKRKRHKERQENWKISGG